MSRLKRKGIVYEDVLEDRESEDSDPMTSSSKDSAKGWPTMITVGLTSM